MHCHRLAALHPSATKALWCFRRPSFQGGDQEVRSTKLMHQVLPPVSPALPTRLLYHKAIVVLQISTRAGSQEDCGGFEGTTKDAAHPL